MRLTKFVHACVLVEDDQHVALFDPGQFSWESGLFDTSKITRLDYILITHEHFDHFHAPFIQALIQKFPEVTIFSTDEVVHKVRELGAKQALTLSNEFVQLKPLAHDSMEPMTPPPMAQNVAIHYKDKISHPGDSHHLDKTNQILFLPLAGPWGSTINAVRMAVVLKPKIIVPIHDWMWNDIWRKVMYERTEAFFTEQEIRFIKPIDGQPFEI